MKKTLLIGLSLLATSVFAQQVSIVIEGTTDDVSGTMLEVLVAPNTEESVTFDLNNLAGGDLGIIVERSKLTDIGNEDYICFGASVIQGTCYPPSQVTPDNPWSTDTEIIPTTAPGWFSPYYINSVGSGEVIYRYFFLDANDNNAKLDSVDIKWKWDSGAIGVDEEDSKTTLSVYPNPAQNQVNVYVGDSKGEVVMLDALGQKVLTSKVNGTAKVDVSALYNGVYFYIFVNENGVATESKRLIVKK